MRTPEQLEAARAARRPADTRRNDRSAHYSTPSALSPSGIRLIGYLPADFACCFSEPER
jgi:hypothetical protein